MDLIVYRDRFPQIRSPDRLLRELADVSSQMWILKTERDCLARESASGLIGEVFLGSLAHEELAMKRAATANSPVKLGSFRLGLRCLRSIGHLGLFLPDQ